jgi:hypothetical protein
MMQWWQWECKHRHMKNDLATLPYNTDSTYMYVLRKIMKTQPHKILYANFHINIIYNSKKISKNPNIYQLMNG